MCETENNLEFVPHIDLTFTKLDFTLSDEGRQWCELGSCLVKKV